MHKVEILVKEGDQLTLELKGLKTERVVIRDVDQDSGIISVVSDTNSVYGNVMAFDLLGNHKQLPDLKLLSLEGNPFRPLNFEKGDILTYTLGGKKQYLEITSSSYKEVMELILLAPKLMSDFQVMDKSTPHSLYNDLRYIPDISLSEVREILKKNFK